MQLSRRLATVRPQLENWWDHGSQEKPLVMVSHLAPEATLPQTDDLVRHWTDVEFVVRRAIARIDATRYHGVALPYHTATLGASSMLLALGAQAEFIDTATVWAHPQLTRIEETLEVSLHPANELYRSMLDITRTSAERAADHHFVAPFALSGVMDNLAGLYGNDRLLVDLIERADEVERAMEHQKRLWIEAFGEVHAIIAGAGNEGTLGWAGIWAPGTTFPIQEDISYMISPEMFDRFSLPHIRDIVDAMEYPFYHLDGIGAIAHLDSLLGIERLKAIQWQPGAGHERLADWYELLERVLDGGKSLQVYATADEIEPLHRAIGGTGVLAIVTGAGEEDVRMLARQGYLDG